MNIYWQIDPLRGVLHVQRPFLINSHMKKYDEIDMHIRWYNPKTEKKQYTADENEGKVKEKCL